MINPFCTPTSSTRHTNRSSSNGPNKNLCLLFCVFHKFTIPHSPTGSRVEVEIYAQTWCHPQVFFFSKSHPGDYFGLFFFCFSWNELIFVFQFKFLSCWIGRKEITSKAESDKKGKIGGYFLIEAERAAGTWGRKASSESGRTARGILLFLIFSWSSFNFSQWNFQAMNPAPIGGELDMIGIEQLIQIDDLNK